MSAYKINLANSAQRHYLAAELLFPTERKDVAGYLFGIAAECAIKQIMSRSGIRPLDPQSRRDDPFFAHFPQMKALLRNKISGRNSQILLRFIETSFMQDWDTDMRYAPSGDIDFKWVERWREHAKIAVHAMNS